jgi:AcrR family transcriptional regulator
MAIPDLEAPEPRLRLIAGLAAAVERKGYAATTIADIVRLARVSKRTFYEHFADKEACFLANYQLGSELALRAVGGAGDRLATWPDQVRAAVASYLGLLQAQPTMTRSLFLAVYAAGPKALALRREVLIRFADLISELVRQARGAAPEVVELSPATATALVGGINELVLLAVERGQAEHLTDLIDTTADLVIAALRGPRA